MPGIFSSIDAYGKKLIHAFFDENKVLPPWFPDLGKISSYVPAATLHWSRFAIEDPKTGITLRGTPDDVFRMSDNSYHIVDYKTAKATEKQDELLPLYEVQLNVYACICNSLGLSPLSGLSLIYTEPQTEIAVGKIKDLADEEAFLLKFKATLKSVIPRAERMIPELLQRARETFSRVAPPEGRDGCKDCALLRRLMAAAQSEGKTP